MNKTISPPAYQRYLVHTARVIIFGCILILIHFQYTQLKNRDGHPTLKNVTPDQLQSYFPDATSLDESSTSDGELNVLGESGDILGYILQTSPTGDRHVGFSGPTNVLLIFSLENRLLGMEIMSSADTEAHVRQVEGSEQFFTSFLDSTKQELKIMESVDGVSGASLTSFSIQESIRRRLGGPSGSMRFPDALTLDDVTSFFPNATRLQENLASPSIWLVYSKEGHKLGIILRTSPAADSTIGYQGPTDCLIALDIQKRVIGIQLGRTYDNETYVMYVRDDEYFLNLFNGSSIGDLAKLNLQESEVEGTSGATMTSIAVARGLILAAQDAQRNQLMTNKTRLSFTPHTIGTALIITLAVLIGFTRSRSHRVVRIGFPMILVMYLGLINGDILSQAMLAGWARHGIPWRSAPGLVLLSVAAVLIPITSRKNIYCHHICPHGAAQQLIRRSSKRRIRLPSRIVYILRHIPGLLLALCVILAMTSTTFSLIDFEPFDAWVFRVAGWATISIAVIGLFASFFIPMAYCRFGCPTGFLLNFLRLNAHSDRWGKTDWGAVILLAISFFIWIGNL